MRPRRDESKEYLLRSILAANLDTKPFMDAAGRVISASAATKTMFGYAEQELVGECHNVIEAHGGRNLFKSRPGEGASFRFAIPTMGGGV